MPEPQPSEDIAVHRFGRTDTDAPTLVLLHGLTDSGRCWPDAVRRWQDAYRIVAWDARGHGGSERFTKGQLSDGVGETHLDDLEGLLESLAHDGVDRPVLVGHSMGGGTAAALAGHRPDLVRAVLLEDPALGTGRRPERESHDFALRRVAEARATNADPRHAMKQGRKEHKRWPDAEFPPWLDAKLQTDLDMLADPTITVRRPWVQVAQAVSVPAMVVTGDREAIWTGALLDELRAVDNDRIEVEVVRKAGHCVRRDRAEEFHAVADPWLAKQLA